MRRIGQGAAAGAVEGREIVGVRLLVGRHRRAVTGVRGGGVGGRLQRRVRPHNLLVRRIQADGLRGRVLALVHGRGRNGCGARGGPRFAWTAPNGTSGKGRRIRKRVTRKKTKEGEGGGDGWYGFSRPSASPILSQPYATPVQLNIPMDRSPRTFVSWDQQKQAGRVVKRRRDET